MFHYQFTQNTYEQQYSTYTTAIKVAKHVSAQATTTAKNEKIYKPQNLNVTEEINVLSRFMLKIEHHQAWFVTELFIGH